MLAKEIQWMLSNFNVVMFGLAIFFMLVNRLVTRGRVPEYEIIYRWLALFCVGFSGIYAGLMHVLYPEIAASAIGWANSPFQYEVGMAGLGFGLIGLLSFNASYGFRLAAVIGNTIWLWGDATGHIYQMTQSHNFTNGNAGSWFILDVFLPLLLIACIVKIRP